MVDDNTGINNTVANWVSIIWPIKLPKWRQIALLLSEGIMKALKREKTSSQKYTVIAL